MNTTPAPRLEGPGPAGARDKAQQAKLHKTCQQFEAVLVGRLLQDMRKTTMPTGLFGKGMDNEIYGSFMDQAVAEKVAARGGFGVAPMMERTLAERARTQAAPEARAAAGSAPISLHAADEARAALPLHDLHPAPGGPVALHAGSAAESGSGFPTHPAPGSFARVATPDRMAAASPARAQAYHAFSTAHHAPGGLGSLAGEIESLPSGTSGTSVPPAVARTAAAQHPAAQARAALAASSERAGGAAVAAAAASTAAPGARARTAPARSGAATDHALEPMITRAAQESGVSPQLLRAVLMTESAGRSGVVSPKGAAGLMQLMPDTAKAMGVKNVFDPQENVRGGARYLAQLLERFGGSVTHALAAYNAGPTAVEKHGGVPPYPETRRYVRRVLGHMARSG